MKKSTYYILTLLFLLAAGLVTPAVAVKHIVHVGSFYFDPSSMNVTVGDTVRWVWDNGSHTTTSTTIPAGAASWDNPINAANTFFEYKVTVAGVHNYKCTPHASMGHLGSFTASAPAPTLTVTPPNQDVTFSDGSTSFSVTSNTNWTATSGASWCTVTPSGSGNGTINAQFTENPTALPRVAEITVTVAGLPSVIVTVSQDGSTVSVAENQDFNFAIYPNPTQGAFKVSSDEFSKGNGSITILDLNGKTVVSQEIGGSREYRFDLSTQPQGFYFIRVKSGDASNVRRLIITR